MTSDTYSVDHALLLLVRAAAAEEADDEDDRTDHDEYDRQRREGVAEEVDIRLQFGESPAADDDEAQSCQLKQNRSLQTLPVAFTIT